MSGDLSARPPNYRRNATALVVNRLCSAIAFSFVGVESVMPAFVRRLTTSAPLVGLIGTVFYGGLLLPQAVIARAVTGRTRKKPFASAALAGRVVFFIVAAALWAGTGAYPAGMLALFFFCLAAFALADGAAMVGWYDIIGRAIPASSRARLYGLAQAIGALAGVGVGAFIGWILGEPDIQFPASYAILFALAGAFFIPSSLALLAIREPDPAHRPCAGVGPSGRGALRIVIGDRRFRRMIACRLLIATMNLSTPFYVGHAADVLGLPEAAIGTFTIAYTASTVVASLLLGALGGRRGPRAVIRIAAAAAAAGPLFALATNLAGGGRLSGAYPLVYVALGVVSSSYVVGFGNYLLELAPEGLGGAYIGLGNTFLGVQAAAPMLGGWLLGATSYRVLFSLSAAGALVAAILSLRLPPSGSLTPPAD